MEEKSKEIPGTYDSLELMYTACAQKGIETALEHAWKGSKEYIENEGSFGVLVKKDKKNTAKYNRNPNVKPINDITANADDYGGMDIQACNKVILFLEVPRKKILEFYKVDCNKWDKCTELCKEMNELRNKYYHKTTKISPEERKQKLIELVRHMEQMISMVYANVPDENGMPYLAKFTQERLQYESEQLKKKYYLSDYLDLSKYDVTKFFTACAELGIKDPGKEDGRLYFHSADLTKDLNLLKNYLTLNDEGKAAPVKAKATPEAKPRTEENVLKKWLKLAVPAILVLVLLIFGGTLAAMLRMGSIFDKDTPGNAGNLLEDAQSMLDSMMGDGQIETADPNSKNQIPEAYAEDIRVLQSSDALKLDAMTLRVEVGATVAPKAAGVWKNGVIYSQDTDVAKPDGQLIQGVAPGETYVVYVKSGMSAAYRVIVTEPEPTVSPDSKNQIPPKYAQDVQLLQIGDAQMLQLMTLEVQVGAYTAPPQAATFRSGVIYSQNTDVALPEGLMVKAISPGETYIVYDNDGLVVVYRVIVSE